jgi:hypothetical protein
VAHALRQFYPHSAHSATLPYYRVDYTGGDVSYRVLPRAGAGGHIPTSGVPLDVGDTVMITRAHEHQVARKLLIRRHLLLLLLLALEVEVPELKFEALLRMHSGNDNEAAFRRPVDGIGVLLLQRLCAHPLSRKAALQLFRSVEKDVSLRRNSSASNGLINSDEDETVALGLPRKVDNDLLQFDDLDRDILFGNAEELERSVVGLLGLGVTVDLDAKVLSFALPMELAVRDVDQVSGSHDLLAGDAHETGTRSLVVHLRSPVSKQLLRLGLALAGDRDSRLPLEINDTVDLDRLLAEQRHLRSLIDLNGLPGHNTRNVLVVGRPLEAGPRDLLASLVRRLGGLDAGERSNDLSSLDVPNDEVLSILIGRQRVVRRDNIRNLDRLVTPGDQVVLSRRVIDQVDKGVRETSDPLPGGSTPQLHTLGVNRGEVSSQRGPLHERLGPVYAVDNLLGGLLLLVPEHTNAVATEHDHLVAGVGLLQPGAEVLLLSERLVCRLDVLLLDLALATEVLNIRELVDIDSVLLVEREAAELLAGGEGLFRGLIFDKGVSSIHQYHPHVVKGKPKQPQEKPTLRSDRSPHSRA